MTEVGRVWAPVVTRNGVIQPFLKVKIFV